MFKINIKLLLLSITVLLLSLFIVPLNFKASAQSPTAAGPQAGFTAPSIEKEYPTLSDRLQKDPVIVGQGGNPGVWRVILNLVDIGLLLFLIFIAFANILRIDLNTYAIKKSLPMLLIGVLLANLSLLICRALVDSSDVLIQTFIQSVPTNVPNCTQATISQPAGQFVCALVNAVYGGGFDALYNAGKGGGTAVLPAFVGLVAFAGLAFGLGGGLIVLVFLAVILVFIPAIAFLILAFLLYIRTYVIVFLVCIAPAAFITLAIPPLQGLFKRWWSEFTRWVFMGPVVFFFLWLAVKFYEAAGQKTNFGTYLIVLFCVYMAIMTPFKMGGAVMAAWGKFGARIAGVGPGGWLRRVGERTGMWGLKRFGTTKEGTARLGTKAIIGALYGKELHERRMTARKGELMAAYTRGVALPGGRRFWSAGGLLQHEEEATANLEAATGQILWDYYKRYPEKKKQVTRFQLKATESQDALNKQKNEAMKEIISKEIEEVDKETKKVKEELTVEFEGGQVKIDHLEQTRKKLNEEKQKVLNGALDTRQAEIEQKTDQDAAVQEALGKYQAGELTEEGYGEIRRKAREKVVTDVKTEIDEQFQPQFSELDGAENDLKTRVENQVAANLAKRGIAADRLVLARKKIVYDRLMLEDTKARAEFFSAEQINGDLSQTSRVDKDVFGKQYIVTQDDVQAFVRGDFENLAKDRADQRAAIIADLNERVGALRMQASQSFNPHQAAATRSLYKLAENSGYLSEVEKNLSPEERVKLARAKDIQQHEHWGERLAASRPLINAIANRPAGQLSARVAPIANPDHIRIAEEVYEDVEKLDPAQIDIGLLERKIKPSARPQFSALISGRIRTVVDDQLIDLIAPHIGIDAKDEKGKAEVVAKFAPHRQEIIEALQDPIKARVNINQIFQILGQIDPKWRQRQLPATVDLSTLSRESRLLGHLDSMVRNEDFSGEATQISQYDKVYEGLDPAVVQQRIEGSDSHIRDIFESSVSNSVPDFKTKTKAGIEYISSQKPPIPQGMIEAWKKDPERYAGEVLMALHNIKMAGQARLAGQPGGAGGPGQPPPAGTPPPTAPPGAPIGGSNVPGGNVGPQPRVNVPPATPVPPAGPIPSAGPVPPAGPIPSGGPIPPGKKVPGSEKGPQPRVE